MHVRAANLDVYILSLLMVTLNVGDTNVMPGIRGVHRECNLCELMRPKRMSDEKFETRWKNMTGYFIKGMGCELTKVIGLHLQAALHTFV
jgi:hypothetical protein